MKRSAPSSSARYETTDGSPQLALLAGAVVVGLIATSLLAGRWFLPDPASPATTAPVQGADASFEHGPAARTSVELDWAEQDRQVRERLGSYGWVQRDSGIVRIPIERAMARLAAPAESTPSSP